MSTSLFASPFLKGNKLIDLNFRVGQLGKAVSCWIILTDLTPNWETLRDLHLKRGPRYMTAQPAGMCALLQSNSSTMKALMN